MLAVFSSYVTKGFYRVMVLTGCCAKVLSGTVVDQ